MNLRACPRVIFLIIPLLVGWALGFAAPARGGEIHRLTWEGPITPVAAEYLVEGINRAEEEGAVALVIRMDTPGGLDTSMRDIIKAQLASTVPIVVYVAPEGSRAASAGAFITLAAHVAAMAPGTNIGSASPVQMGGAEMDSTMASKVKNDAAAYIASIASGKGRNEEVARAFVTEALNLTADEALAEGVIEIIALNLAALTDSLEGRTVTVAGVEVVLELAGSTVTDHDPSPRQKFLKRLADPNLAYILMLLGIYGLFFELSNPGAFAPGILGGICLLLALFAFQALPVDYTGVGLIILGVVMLILEIKVPSYGALSIGGITALVLGSLMLFDSPEQWARLSLRVLVPSVMVFAGFFLLCVWMVIRAQKRRVTTGPEALVGETGRVLKALEPGGEPGKVLFHGEIWDAVCESSVARNGRVRVLSVEGRLARVEPESTEHPQPGS
jgi:membrane-bound serine protease (ClpP class)